MATQGLTMKTTIICTLMIGAPALVASAQNNILWQTPVTISGPTDVNTSGTYFGSWAPNAANALTVNGVTFQNFSDLPSLSTSFENSTGTGSFQSPLTSDNNYNTLLTSGAFQNDSSSPTVSWGGLTIGDTYLVQVWVNDGRNSTVDARTETITGGANTSASLAYGSGNGPAGSPPGLPGQYVIGTFVAGTTGETVSLNAGPAIPSAQLNLLQVRDITSVPEPSTLAFVAMGIGAMLLVFRRKNQAA
jgi:hypothetical protein